MRAATLFLAFVTLERLGDLWLARRNTRALLAAGAVERGAAHYPLVVALHAAWLAGLWLLARDRDVSVPWFAAFAALQALRVWTLATLGARWTVTGHQHLPWQVRERSQCPRQQAIRRQLVAAAHHGHHDHPGLQRVERMGSRQLRAMEITLLGRVAIRRRVQERCKPQYDAPGMRHLLEGSDIVAGRTQQQVRHSNRGESGLMADRPGSTGPFGRMGCLGHHVGQAHRLAHHRPEPIRGFVVEVVGEPQVRTLLRSDTLPALDQIARYSLARVAQTGLTLRIAHSFETAEVGNQLDVMSGHLQGLHQQAGNTPVTGRNVVGGGLERRVEGDTHAAF